MNRRCNVCIACLHPIFFLFGEFFFCFLSPILNFLEYNKKLEKMKTIYEWIADYSAGTLTEPEAKVFRDRLENDGEVKRLFTDVRQMETVLKMLEVETSAEAWERLQKALSGMRNRRRRIRRTIAAGIAAAIVLFLGVGVILWRPIGLPPVVATGEITPGTTKATLLLADGEAIALDGLLTDSITVSDGTVIVHDTLSGLQYRQQEEDTVVHYHTIRVPRGGEYRFRLPDGSQVWINSASELRFPTRFTGRERVVYASGELYFDVQADAEHPFVVEAGDSRVTVLGPAFNLNTYPEEQQVLTTLVRGAVEFQHGNASVRLKPGQQAVLDVRTQQLDTRQVDVSLYTSWVNGIFEYERMPLADIMRQLARWYDIGFIFEAAEFHDHPLPVLPAAIRRWMKFSV